MNAFVEQWQGAISGSSIWTSLV